METKQISRADALNHLVALRRLEAREHRRAEAECNGDHYWTVNGREYDLWSDEDSERLDQLTLNAVSKILGYRPLGFFVNGDPRGYALKVQPEFAGDLPTDWGGYGIIAPSPDTIKRHTL